MRMQQIVLWKGQNQYDPPNLNTVLLLIKKIKNKPTTGKPYKSFHIRYSWLSILLALKEWKRDVRVLSYETRRACIANSK